ncbi:hypothetical protein [Flavihumibacter sp. CACIAM 22H1]|uniref:LA_0442/LA_0875 N-terminal domain-containing protein n=1 Tax=Flavihumibacter sp. CACIAM 22H1 TaxID=1812911 RepID=UPI0007A8EBF4|nr:hypothetical protein [Flavihumibacter sp. CACIAM 22H1]KYP15422.1 MAG: hypothetical protein A1D16_12925 [Flavihumibacter sp. CACIAM 22H1]
MKFLPIFFFSLFCFSSFGQGKKEDVLYLKNGSIIRGKILENNDQQAGIQVQDGTVWKFSKAEILEIKSENRFRNLHYKSKGFAHFTELGPLVAGKTTVAGVTTAAFSFQTINGYKFSQAAMVGFGTGVDLYATQTVVPLFASFRGDLSSKGTVLPFYFIDAGYGANITQNAPNGEDFKGGLLYAAGLGVKIPFNRSAGFLLSMGYRYQKTSSERGLDKFETTYRRLAIRAGFFL